MKFKKIIAVGIVLFLAFINSYGQTAEEVVNKYFAAIGGKEKLVTMKTLYSEGDMSIMNNPSPFVTSIIDGIGYKNEINFNGQKVVTCYTATGGWTVNPLAGIPNPVEMQADQVNIGKMTFDLKGPLFDYIAKGSKLEMGGKEKLNGADVYKLKLITHDGTEMNFYIDAATWYVLKMTTKLNISGNEFEIVTTSSNYQKTNLGVFMPFTQETSYPGLTVISTSKTIAFNKDIDTSVFVMPKN
jgi:hypothetical protein